MGEAGTGHRTGGRRPKRAGGRERDPVQRKARPGKLNRSAPLLKAKHRLLPHFCPPGPRPRGHQRRRPVQPGEQMNSQARDREGAQRKGLGKKALSSTACRQ